jgi:hypothetical protein
MAREANVVSVSEDVQVTEPEPTAAAVPDADGRSLAIFSGFGSEDRGLCNPESWSTSEIVHAAGATPLANKDARPWLSTAEAAFASGSEDVSEFH